MTIDEAKHKLDYMKKAYQKLIDEKVDSGKLVGDGVRGEWKAETPLDEAYKSMIDALEMAIKALEQQPTDAVDRVTIKEYLDSYEVAQPKMGRWIKNAEEWQNVDPPYICSECGRASLRQENFCCSCGADMRGDTDADID